MAIVILRYWAAAKEAAGVAEEKVSAQTLAAALEAGLAAVRERAESGPTSAGPMSAGPMSAGSAEGGSAATGPTPHEPGRSSRDRAERLRLVLARSSFLIDGDPVGTRPPESVRLSDAAVIEVLPPFAGG